MDTTPDESAGSTTIILSKSPSVVINKGGSCTIGWQINNLPTGANCVLSGWGIGNMIIGRPDPVSSTTVPGLLANQKYSVTCSGGNPLMTPVNASLICRINPNVIEN
jgi:hypothetical protein